MILLAVLFLAFFIAILSIKPSVQTIEFGDDKKNNLNEGPDLIGDAWQYPTVSVDALDLSNEDVLKALIAEVRNTTIVSVYYGIANYQHRPYHYEGFHLCDFGVFFKLSNGGWLNWVWVEEKEDGDYGIEISQINLIGRLSVEANFIEVSDSVEWRALLRRRITKAEFEISEFGVYEHINRMKLEFEDKTVVSICSIEEPDPYRLPSLDSLRFGKDWTIVIFDQLVLQKLVF